MKSLKDEKTKQEFIARIGHLTENVTPQWGKMNVSQMLRHLSEFIELAENKKTVTSNRLVSFLLGRILKGRLLSSDKPLPKGVGSAKMPTNKGFEAEKNYLLNVLKSFQLKNLSRSPLPVFGKMSTHEWDRMLTKQFEHHLTQFGV